MTSAELIGPDLVPQSIKIASLRDQTLNYFDQRRTLQSAPIDSFVQLRAIGGEQAESIWLYPCVRLTDGQRFTGECLGATPDGAGLKWRHDLLGTFVIALDQIVDVAWGKTELSIVPNATSVADRITLINGDTLNGYVSSLGEQGIHLIPDVGGEPVSIPYGRVASLRLANPMRESGEISHRVTLADGTRVRARDIALTGETASWRFTPPGGATRLAEVPMTELARIDFEAGGLRLVGLADVPMQDELDTRVFGLPIPARVQARSIRAHAPTELTFDLPRGATRLAATVELDVTEAPNLDVNWADFQVVVLCEGAVVARIHLTGDHPVDYINAPVAGGRLVIRLETGMNGPILDRLLLRDAEILVRTLASEPTGVSGR